MSGFEVAGLVVGVLPILVKGLQFYEDRSQVMLHHRDAMNDLVVSLHVEHSRFRHYCSIVLKGLVDDADLELFLDTATEEDWKRALKDGLEKSLKKKLGYKYYAYTGTMARIQEGLKELGEVVGIKGKQRWYDQTEYGRARTWKKLKSCLAHSKHKQLLASVREYNTQLEQLTPGVSFHERAAPHQMDKVDVGHWDSIRRAALSLHCALCSGWLCRCIDAHATHLQLEDRIATNTGPHRFKLAFMLPAVEDDGALVGSFSWQQAEFETLEEKNEDISTPPLPLPLRSPGRVGFAPLATSVANGRLMNKQIMDLCRELQQSSDSVDSKCIGFLPEEEHTHYIHLPKRPLAPCVARNTITLHHLLTNKGKLSPQYTFGNEVVDRYELALLLASSLLQLHTTSWLGDWWSTESIHFLPTKSSIAFRSCTFVVQTFPSTALVADTSNRGRESARQLAIRNEAIFRLGAILVELSTVATLESQETRDDGNIAELTDFNTAERLSREVTLNNAVEWNEVVDKCLRCGFHCPPDFGRRDFRKEFYEWVVAPLQRLYADAKLD